jgi:hypothetical protein
VAFRLVHAEGSDAEAGFLRAIQALAAIPGVEAFELMREVSPKNDYRFALTMEFDGSSSYAAYNGHADHVRFVADRWDAEVADFLEIDAERL